VLYFLWFGVMAYPALQIFLLVRPLDGSRAAVALPLFVMVPVFVITISGLLQQSNLWPLFLLLTSPVAFLYLLIVVLVRVNARQ
jgi:hypothetical protein